MKISKKKKKIIGFIGTGVMGKAMAKNLVKSGYCVFVYTRNKEKAEDLLNLGAIWKNSVQKIARASNVIISMVGSPKDVEEIYFSESGILESANQDTFLIDMTIKTIFGKMYISGSAVEKFSYS